MHLFSSPDLSFFFFSASRGSAPSRSLPGARKCCENVWTSELGVSNNRRDCLFSPSPLSFFLCSLARRPFARGNFRCFPIFCVLAHVRHREYPTPPHLNPALIPFLSPFRCLFSVFFRTGSFPPDPVWPPPHRSAAVIGPRFLPSLTRVTQFCAAPLDE